MPRNKVVFEVYKLVGNIADDTIIEHSNEKEIIIEEDADAFPEAMKILQTFLSFQAQIGNFSLEFLHQAAACKYYRAMILRLLFELKILTVSTCDYRFVFSVKLLKGKSIPRVEGASPPLLDALRVFFLRWEDVELLRSCEPFLSCLCLLVALPLPPALFLPLPLLLTDPESPLESQELSC